MLITSLPNEPLRHSKIADQTPLPSNLPIHVFSPPPAGLSGRASLHHHSGCNPRRGEAGGVEGDVEDCKDEEKRRGAHLGEEKVTAIFRSARNLR